MVRDTLIKDFEDRFTWLFERMVSYEENSRHELLVTLDDGRTLLYSFRDLVPREIKVFDNPAELTNDEWLKGFNDNLYRQLRKANMTQYMLAKRIGVTDITISRYMTCKSMPPSNVLHKISAVLGCSVDDLVPHDYIIK